MTTWACGPVLEPTVYARVRQRLIFDCHKWDPQAGDVEVLARYPLLLDAEVAAQLARWSEQLAREMLAAEAELAMRPELQRDLGLPRTVRRMLFRTRGPHGERPEAPAGPRYTRFDWHLTREGWRISEANADVPGGLIEAGGLADLMAEHCEQADRPENPAAVLAEALGRASDGHDIALVHATAYTDDRQVMVYLAQELRERGLRGHLVAPDQIAWRDGRAWIQSAWHTGPADAVFRFFPAEWLANLRRSSGREGFFAQTLTPQTNPATALLVQSKRWPLVWDRLGTELPNWRRLLPETRDPRDVDWRRGEWVLKPSLGRVGDGIGMHGLTEAAAWRQIRRSVWLFPGCWAAQRRFEAVLLRTPDGDRYPCIGVYVIDGRAAGMYGRLARKPLVDAWAQDVAVLVASLNSPQTESQSPAGVRHGFAATA